MTPALARAGCTLALLAVLASCSTSARPDPAASPPPVPSPPPAAFPPPVPFPDPAPGGPTRPFEPVVPGPTNVDALTVTVRPDGGAPDGVEVSFDRSSRAETGGKPAAARRFVFLFDRSVGLSPESFPTCERAVLEGRGIESCPAGSRVGSGRATTFPDAEADVAVLNTRYPDGGRGVLITIPATGAILENRFEPVDGARGGDYAMASDEIVPPTAVLPAERGATTRFRVSFGAVRQEQGRPVSFVRSGAEPGSPLRFGLWSEFVTGQVLQPETSTPRPRFAP